MGKNIMVAIVLGALAILACVAFACARSRPAPVPSASAGTTPAPCPPGAKYCVSPGTPGAREEIGPDATKIAQLVEPVTARVRVHYADNTPTKETNATISPGVWLVPEDAIDRTEVVE